MATFRINLYPLDNFFFGTNKLGELGNRQDYFISSSWFPQQTTALGMLRYQLLLQNDCLQHDQWKIKDKDKADQLSGKTSFYPTQTDYGCIKRLSPVFLCKGDQDFYLSNHERAEVEDAHSKETEEKKGQETVLQSTAGGQAENLLSYTESGSLLTTDNAWKFEHFTAKRGWRKQFVNKVAARIDAREVIAEEITAHNHKSMRGTSFEQAYFKERRYRLTEDYGFSFYTEIDHWENHLPTLDNNIVRMGGRQSWFKMKVERVGEYPDWSTHFYQSKPHNQRLLLLSDACVVSDFQQYCYAMAGTMIPFRNLMTNNRETSNFHNLSKGKKAGYPQLSQYQYLLQRGAVLYLKKDVAPSKIFKTELPGFNTIGYNQYILPS